MNPAPLDFHPQAAVEARRTRRRYARHSVAVATRFVAELDRAIAEIRTAPQRWPAYLHGTRVFALRRFPYLIVYHEQPAVTQVVAVAHASRRPGYWRRRLP